MPRLLQRSRRLLRLTLLAALGVASLGVVAPVHAELSLASASSMLSKLVPTTSARMTLLQMQQAEPDAAADAEPAAAEPTAHMTLLQLQQAELAAAVAEPAAAAEPTARMTLLQLQQAELAAAEPAPAILPTLQADASQSDKPLVLEGGVGEFDQQTQQTTDMQQPAAEGDSSAPRSLEAVIGEIEVQPSTDDSARPQPGATEGTDADGKPIVDAPPEQNVGITASLTAWQIALCAVGGFLCCSFVTGGTHRACGGHLGNDCEALCACIAGCICFECCRGGGAGPKEPLLG